MAKRKVQKTILLLFIMLASIWAAVFLGAEHFQIEHIEVFGNDQLQSEDIIKLSGIERYDNILKLDKPLIKRRLESNPYIMVKNIGRSYPDGVYIDIIERKKGAIIPYLASDITIDRYGVVLEIDDRDTNDRDYPFITGLNVKGFVKGEKIVPGDGYQFRALLRILEGIYEEGIEDSIYEIHMDDPNDIYIISRDGINIKLGQAINVDDKLKWLTTEEFESLEPNSLSNWVFDISVLGRATFSPVTDWSEEYE
ncbi:MAG: FtsQ-type POTRA domain-containing protein [Clostridiales bacterium]|nr:FtsQ-type POTRA domain-containing protein [Clostridiales bacterium]